MLQNGGVATAAAADGLIKETTTQTFVKDVIEESKRQPVLIDFWAPWCGPCKQLTPVLEKAVKAAKGKVKLVKMNIDEHPAIPGQMGIQSIPAVIAFVNGQPADGFMGALPESQVMAFLERLTKEKIGAGDADLLKAAEQALADKDHAGAAEIYAQILAEDGASIPALAGLARARLVHRRGDRLVAGLVRPVGDLRARGIGRLARLDDPDVMREARRGLWEVPPDHVAGRGVDRVRVPAEPVGIDVVRHRLGAALGRISGAQRHVHRPVVRPARARLRRVEGVARRRRRLVVGRAADREVDLLGRLMVARHVGRPVLDRVLAVALDRDRPAGRALVERQGPGRCGSRSASLPPWFWSPM